MVLGREGWCLRSKGEVQEGIWNSQSEGCRFRIGKHAWMTCGVVGYAGVGFVRPGVGNWERWRAWFRATYRPSVLL